MKKEQKNMLIVIGALAVLGIAAFVVFGMKRADTEVGVIPLVAEEQPALPVVTPQNPPLVVPDTVPEGPKEGQEYYVHTMKTANASAELAALVGVDNVPAVLQTNRIDERMIKQGATLVIPVSFDSASRSPFPLVVAELEAVPKLLMFSQRVQAFGAYENGKLVRWGPISSGKQSTPTPSKLYSTNWKGKEVQSSFDDEWILKYNFNLDNFEGVGFHQYEMPGYPASHSCVRLLLPDALWLYDWAEQWILSPDERTRIAHGTPVIIFGQYAFGKTAPWKLLPENADATDITEPEIQELVALYLATIMERQAVREAYIAGLTMGN